MKSVIERKLGIGFAIVVVLLLLITGAYFRIRAHHEVLGGWVSHTHEVLVEIERTQVRVDSAQTASYRYFLSGNPAYLKDRARSLREIENEAQTLLLVTADNPNQQANLRRFLEQMTARIRLINQGIALRRQQRLEQINVWLNEGSEQRLSEDIRMTLVAIQKEEERLLVRRQHDYQRLELWLNGAFLSLTGVICLALTLIYRKIRSLDARQQNAHTRVVTTLESITDAFFSVDLEWRFTYVNSEAERLLRKTRDEILGCVFWEVFPRAAETEFGRNYRRAVMEKKAIDFLEFSAPFDGWYEIHAYPSSEGLSVYFREVTDRIRADEALQEAKRFSESIAENSASSIYVLDLETKTHVYTNRNAQEFLGYSLEEMQQMGTEFVAQTAHPDDYPMMLAHLDEFSELPDGEVMQFEARIRHQRGVYHWIWFRESVFKRTAEGVPTQILGIALDITEKRDAENTIRKSETRFRAAIDGSMDCFFLLESVRNESGVITDFVFVEVNRQGQLMLGLNHEHIVGQKLCELIPINRTGGFFDKYAQVVETREALDEEFALNVSEIHAGWIHHQVVPVGDGVAITSRNVTEAKLMEEQIGQQMLEVNEARTQLEMQAAELQRTNAQLAEMNARLETLATTDGLTGLKNHRTFQENLADAYGRAVRYGSSLSVILLDVDKFKSYNDTFGHPAGDRVLKQVAAILQENARMSDLVARYGGEEFVILLPETDAVGARDAAERFRAAIESAEWTERGVTASFGVATLDLNSRDAADLVAEADKALYCSKQQGRNRVSDGQCCASPRPEAVSLPSVEPVALPEVVA